MSDNSTDDKVPLLERGQVDVHELGLAALACSIGLLLDAAHRTAVHIAHSSETLHSKLRSPSLILAQAVPDLGSCGRCKHYSPRTLQAANSSMVVVNTSTQARVHSLFALVIAAHCQDDMATGLSNLQAGLIADARVATCSKEAPPMCHLMMICS